ncbi:alpha/beta fold hydrolase [Natrinema soli]|uniref:Alpha/beta fold hydrolase n=1 Tax=Natrinema soli TaxID=1930624 RepID=A0ABD5SH58_9EURY|nr:alpha/beta fold hydrolase [Natrinema soli]
MTIYRSEEGKRELEHWYDIAVDHLEISVDETHIETRYGSTHVLLAGPADGPPIFVFHGGNATNPMTLAWYIDLADEYRLIAPDTVGHPGKSAETRLDPEGDEYGKWVVDVLDAFDVDAAPMIGTSYGAGIIVRTGAYAPDRIECAALVVPAGFGTGPIRPLLKVGLQSVLYRFVPRDRILDYVTSALVTEAESDRLARSTIGASLRYVELEREMPDSTAAELADFTAPVALHLSEADPFFPPEVIVPRARERLPSLSNVETLPGERHILSPSAREAVTSSIRAFLDDVQC